MRKGAILRRQGRWPQAIESYERAMTLDPRGYSGAHSLAVSHTVVRNYAVALSYYEQAISLRPEGIADLGGRAEVLWLWTGDTQAAREALESIPESLQNEGATRWY